MDTRIINLQSCQNSNELLDITRKAIKQAIKASKPDVVVVEELSAKRSTKINQAMLGVIDICVNALPNTELIRLSRKEACLWVSGQFSASKEKGMIPTIRNLARCMSSTCPELAFNPPPVSQLRTDWDRTWGQAIVAAALALHARAKHC